MKYLLQVQDLHIVFIGNSIDEKDDAMWVKVPETDEIILILYYIFEYLVISAKKWFKW